ncbi:predicted protein [Aspergillus nidulans FGSC A4]|uniref:Uncharacterized protein n=1 Tax=Emericella nidulans (strain FGSC A4 / ATCC 38163 / CBS 112.46 / NRRL 194 / M139) TaxID=227321 RepID=Q5BG16_EMENI|nr:hypothetical protein [Aspergillus nidulans FGSC A4]EAA66613.1 predicted protein [Aspergillus nidulans FGSC A4]CBF89331.1 TPA: hypothetical protein ANIA_00514 [Aspergillus nidulans FGSC A4]|eukprot:XP_658118.1 predicted protein [Aspergillus nidulans FGSC A4]
MLTQELQRLGRELSSLDRISEGEEGSELEGTTQINQLNIVLSFVTMAQKPLTVTQLEAILEIIFREEVLNLEDDLCLPEMEADDRLPLVILQLLIFYNNMLAYYTSENINSRENTPMDMQLYHSQVYKIFAAAEIYKFQQTLLWHVRVAQALLLNGHLQEAQGQFQIALEEHKSAPTFDQLLLFIIYRDMARACSDIRRHGEALEHHELSEQLESLLAQLQHNARRTADAVKTANEA